MFALASLAGGVTSSGALLIGARFLKGAASAFTAPAGLSIITTSFAEGPERNRALSLYGATGASGFFLGLVIGGLTTQVGWRLAFLLPAPFALALLIAGLRVLPPEIPRLHYARRLDLGALTLAAAMLLLVRTVVEAPSSGWASGPTVGAFAVTVLLLVAFAVIERRSRSPLLRLGLLRSGALVRANLGIMTLFGAYVGFQFVITLYLQAMNHWSPIKTALAFLPLAC